MPLTIMAQEPHMRTRQAKRYPEARLAVTLHPGDDVEDGLVILQRHRIVDTCSSTLVSAPNAYAEVL
jgi:hypothetical protein